MAARHASKKPYQIFFCLGQQTVWLFAREDDKNEEMEPKKKLTGPVLRCRCCGG